MSCNSTQSISAGNGVGLGMPSVLLASGSEVRILFSQRRATFVQRGKGLNNGYVRVTSNGKRITITGRLTPSTNAEGVVFYPDGENRFVADSLDA